MKRTRWVFACLCAALATQVAAQDHVISERTLDAHTRFLADDLLLGRATGSDGARLAALYIESACRRLGLLPPSGGYRQPVQLEEASILPSTTLRLSRGPGEVGFSYPMDFIPDIGTTGTNDGFEGRAVFVGGERDLLDGDLGELDLRGRVAVTAEPVREAAVDTLIRRGAVGMIHLVADPAVFRLYVQSRGPTRLQHRDTSIASSFFPRLPSLIVGPRVTSALIDGMALAPNDRLFPQPLAWDVRADIGSINKPVDDENVVCVLPGTDRAARDTAIALSAHYDHLGISTPDDAGDSIYNGFSDNAAGVGMLLAIAEALGHPSGRRPRHSVLFLFFTGEERGLLGSDAYVAAPAWPLDRTLALINLDAGAPPAAPTSWRLAGVDSTGLGAVAARVAERRQWQVVTSEARANSDYFPFHRRGVPAVFVVPGTQPYEGLSEDSSAALRTRWDRYHLASDHWQSDFPFAGLQRYAAFALEIVLEADSTLAR